MNCYVVMCRNRFQTGDDRHGNRLIDERKTGIVNVCYMYEECIDTDMRVPIFIWLAAQSLLV